MRDTLNTSILYRFSVYKHQLVIFNDRLITRQFIVLKDSNGNIIHFTLLHKFIYSSRNNIVKSISDDGNNRHALICSFLNYLFIDSYSKYKVTSLTEITIEMIQDYFRNYTLNPQNQIRSKTEQTVKRCATVILDFLCSYLDEYEYCTVLKKNHLIKTTSYRSKVTGKMLTKSIPAFDIFHAGRPRQIFRDMPNSVFEMFMSYSLDHYPDISLMIGLSSFAGLRPSEVCNVRQEISPLGSGILLKNINGKVTAVQIDLSEEKNLRSDLKPVGKIKKERKQGVYPRFLTAFLYLFERHKEYLAKNKFEKAYCPMFVNTHGKAMTYPLYRDRFQKMTKELIPILLASDIPEIVEYGHCLLENSISPHIFRHWFSVKLCLYGEDIAGLQYWRGDNNPQSALTYLQNKGELERQLSQVNNTMFDFVKKAAEKDRYSHD